MKPKRKIITTKVGKAQFTHSAAKTKKINIQPTGYRGTWRF